MTTQDLLCKIKKLESVEPDRTWIRSNKAFIFDYIRAQESKNNGSFVFRSPAPSLSEKMTSLVFGLRRGILMPAVSAMTILFMTGGLVMAKANEALPGDTLYTVKIVTEKVQLALTFKDEERATLNFELAEKRLNELSLLTEENTKNGKENGEAVNVAMESFKNHLNEAVSEFDTIVKQDAGADRAVAVAKIANTKTADYAKRIEKTKIALDKKSTADSKSQVAEVMSKIEAANISSLSILVSADGQTSSDSGDLISKIEEKIKNTEDKISLIEQTKASGTNSYTLSSDDKNVVSQLIGQVKGVLSEAKADLSDKEPFKALEKVVASNEIVGAAQKIVGVSDNTVASDGDKVQPSVSPVQPSPSSTPVPSRVEGPKPSVSPSPSVTPKPSVTPTPTPTPEASESPVPSASVLPDDGGVKL